MEQQQQSDPSQAGPLKDEKYTIDAETARRYVEAWQFGGYNLVPSTVTPGPEDRAFQLDSFLFSVDDFKEYVASVDKYNKDQPAENQVTGTICRMGLKPNPVTGGEGLVPALFFEPVVGFCKEPLYAGKCQPNLSPVEISARYDFSYPCPPTCAS